MKKATSLTLRLFAASAFCTILSLTTKAQFSIAPDQTAADLLQAMTGQNVVISNETLTCMDTANALFNFTGTALGISDGIILYTGRVDQLSNPWNFTLTHSNNTPGDANITAIAGFGTFDACALEFDVVPAYDTLFLRYIIGSDEFPEYSCSYFADQLGFFINGGGYTDSNFAQFPDTNIYVTGARIACPMDTFAFQYYIDNYVQQSPDIAFDGYSLPIESSIVVTPGVSYHVKIALADVSDMAFDTGILIEGGSLGSKNALSVAYTKRDNNKAEVYPNPFTAGVSIKLNDELNRKDLEVSVSDIVGRRLYHYTGKGSHLNEQLKSYTSQLVSGIYTLIITSGDYKQMLKLQKN